jgi:ribosomal protein S18 acetylase RimI-like enzyme
MIEAHIDQLYVDPSHQRCGVGSLLLDQAIASAPGRTTLRLKTTKARALSMRNTAFESAIDG